MSGCWATTRLCLDESLSKEDSTKFSTVFRGVLLNELNLIDVSKCWVSQWELISSWSKDTCV